MMLCRLFVGCLILSTLILEASAALQKIGTVAVPEGHAMLEIMGDKGRQWVNPSWGRNLYTS